MQAYYKSAAPGTAYYGAPMPYMWGAQVSAVMAVIAGFGLSFWKFIGICSFHACVGSFSCSL